MLVALAVAAALLILTALVPDRRIAAFATAGICGTAALADFGYLVAGAPLDALAVPLGLPGIGAILALDGLSAVFLLLMFVTGCAAALASVEDNPNHSYNATSPAFPVFLGGMALVLLAGDAFTLMTGFEAMSIASFVLVLTFDDEAGNRAASLLYLGMAVFSTVCLVPALILLAPKLPLGEAIQFAAMRVHPPEGWRAAVVLALVMLGAGAKAGLLPLHVWLPPAHSAAPAHVSAVMSGAMTKVAIYVLIRLLFDLCGPAQPMWWCAPLLIAGGLGAFLGGLRATMEPDIKSVLACSTIEHVSLIATAIGVAFAARASDLTPLAALAIGAALLHTLAHGTFKSLLFLSAGVVQAKAGTRALAYLGGLIHHMPRTTACAMIGAASLAALPPTSGFAGEWTLFQALFGAPRVGGLAFQVLICVVAALVALAAALAAVAAVRLIGVAFLGRPRSPRSAGASEAGPITFAAMAGLAALTSAIGLFPGPVMSLAGPAIRLLLPGGGDATRQGIFVLSPSAAMPGYVPLGVALLLAVIAGLGLMARRHFAKVGAELGGPPWDCGYTAPPQWLPFGNTAAQYGAASFSQPLRRMLGASILHAHEAVEMRQPGDTRPGSLTVTMRDPAAALLFGPLAAIRSWISVRAEGIQFLTVRRTLTIMFGSLVLFLALIALWEQA